MSVKIDDILNVAKFVNENKDKLKDLDWEKFKLVAEDFAKQHEEELKKLGDKAIDVIFKIVKGKLGEAEIDYLQAVKGKGPAQLLEEARSDIHAAREDGDSFMNFVKGLGVVLGTFAKAAVKSVGIPL